MLRVLPWQLVSLLLCAFSVRAQTFEPGLLVKANGDTLRGEVENRFWVEPPTFIRFRAVATAEAQVLQPRQLQAFTIQNGRLFRFVVLPLDHSAETRLNDLPRGNHPNVQLDSVLAEVLVSGNLSLLRVVRPGATHYALQRQGQPDLVLNERKYLRQASGGEWVVTDGNNYRNQLALYLNACPAAGTAAQTADFTAMGLAAVVQMYNGNCSPNQQLGRSLLSHAAPRRRESFQGGLLAGLRYSQFTYESGSQKACADCTVRPFGGIYAELLQPSRTAALYGELTVSSFRYEGQGVIPATLAMPSTSFSYAYRGWLSTARLGVRFFFLRPQEQQWLLGFGLESNRIFNQTATFLSNPSGFALAEEMPYPQPTLLPNITVGWRRKRSTLLLDGQLYRSNNSYSGSVFGSFFTLRTGLSYRLGRNPDEQKNAAANRL